LHHGLDFRRNENRNRVSNVNATIALLLQALQPEPLAHSDDANGLEGVKAGSDG
jgi:hypothetical protein